MGCAKSQLNRVRTFIYNERGGDRSARRAASGIATDENRLALIAVALARPAFFVAHCREAQIVNLLQFPWWLALCDSHPWECAVLKAEARKHGIRY